MVSGAFCTALLTPMLELPIIDPLAAVGLALLVAVLAVRALGQTDLNPVSGVGKLSQVHILCFYCQVYAVTFSSGMCIKASFSTAAELMWQTMLTY